MSEQKEKTPEEIMAEYLAKAKSEMQHREPVQVPKEYLWAGGAAALAIVVTAWPALILGAILGAFMVFKVGCNNGK